MVFQLYCICYTFVLDKYDDIFVSTLASFVSRQMLYQICLTFVFEPNTVKCMISSSVKRYEFIHKFACKDIPVPITLHLCRDWLHCLGYAIYGAAN